MWGEGKERRGKRRSGVERVRREGVQGGVVWGEGKGLGGVMR